MDIRKRCVMKLDVWAKFKEGSEDFIPFIEVGGKNETYLLPEYKRVMFEKNLGRGEVCWIENNTKEYLQFKCDCWTWVEDMGCFRISTLEEAQELFEHKKHEESSEYSAPKKQHKKKKEVVLTLVQDQGCYALLDRETNVVKGHFVLLTKPSEYPKYSQLIAGMRLFTKGISLTHSR